jgi:hypothetical protein
MPRVGRLVTADMHETELVRLPHGKQWRCTGCAWAGTVVMYGDADAHAQAAAAAVRHEAGITR